MPQNLQEVLLTSRIVKIECLRSIQRPKVISDIHIFQRFLECVGCPSVFGPAIQHDVALAVLIEKLVPRQMIHNRPKVASRLEPAYSIFQFDKILSVYLSLGFDRVPSARVKLARRGVNKIRTVLFLVIFTLLRNRYCAAGISPSNGDLAIDGVFVLI